MEHINIIGATRDHTAILQQLAITTFLDTYAQYNTEQDMKEYVENYFSLSQLEKEITSPDSTYYIGFHHNQPICYIKLNTGPAQTDLKDTNALEIERIYVLKEFQGLKAGRQLLDKAIEVARHKQAAYIWLGVWEKNVNAMGFYKKQGFIPFSTHIFKLGADEQLDILMKLEV